MAERKPEFISLMRTIRDVYYKEMGEAVAYIKEMSDTFTKYVQQITNASVRSTTTVAPIDLGTPTETFGVAVVTVDTVSDPSKMQFDFSIPAGLTGATGATGQGVTISGSDTCANIVLNTSALLGECYISTDIPTCLTSLPPSGVAAIGDGLTPVIDSPLVETDWINVGPMRGPAGDDGSDGTDGTNGVNGTNGEKWWIVPTAPSYIGDIPGSAIGDFALVSTISQVENGQYYELFGDGWRNAGQLKGNQGDIGVPGSVWYNGNGVPSDTLGIDGDYYVDYATNSYYYKDLNTWGSPIGSLDANAVTSLAGSGGVAESDAVVSVVSCTQAEYEAGTPQADYLYVIVV